MLPCPRHGCHSAFPEPLDEAVALYRCDVCGSWAVAERTEEGYYVYEAQMRPERLRKGDKVLVRDSIWYIRPMRSEIRYSIITLSAGGNRPRDEDGGRIDPLRIVAVLKPAEEVSQ